MIKLHGQIVPRRLFGSVRVARKAHNGKFQAKTATPSRENQTIVADAGYDALSLVTVEAARLQEKTVTPSALDQTVVPDFGVLGLSKVIVKAQGNHGLLQEKTVSPSTDPKTVTPDDGYYGLASVQVNGDENLVPENIVEGVTIFGVEGANSQAVDLLDRINGEVV